MRILLTNDDGIDAPGLDALWKAVTGSLAGVAEVTVVAPDRGRSECSHGVTTGRPLNVHQRRPGWFAVDGTPVDCVRVGLSSICPQTQAVISGVNAGANLGVDLLVSGTFAAAREAAIERVPAMAVSHYRHPDVPSTWDHVPDWLATTLREFTDNSDHFWSTSSDDMPLVWNVNLPAIVPENGRVPPRVRCAVDSRPLRRIAKRTETRITFESDFHGRPRDAESDVACCFSGAITISEVPPHPATTTRR